MELFRVSERFYSHVNSVKRTIVMLHNKIRYATDISFLLFCWLLVGCGISTTIGTSSQHQVTLKQCDISLPASTVTMPAPTEAQETLYATSLNHLYAVNASNGALRWCQQLQVTGKTNCPLGASCPGGPNDVLLGTPAVADGIVYVCASGIENMLYAFNIGKGTLQWQTPSDCGSASPAFLHYATPFVQNGVVYDGTYALRASDGKVLWHASIDVQQEGGLEMQVLEGNTLYANTQNVIYAIDASNGKILWHYTAPTHQPFGGPLVVADQKLYVGTLGSADDPQSSRFYALKADSGALLWQYQMGDYQGAVAAHGVVYAGSRSRSLYAFQGSGGQVLWKHVFASPIYQRASIAENVLYMNSDGAYALRSKDGSVLWHRNLASGSGVLFTPSVVDNGILYVAAGNQSTQHSTLYALNASSGVTYWQRSYPFVINPFTISNKQ